tara:strand:- start:326 stop:1606 length:1281 start_codon:yes stop_codon:yes gene_type:complete
MTTKVQAEFLAAGIISDQTQVSAADADHLLIFDASDNSLKKALVSTITSSGASAADDITAGDAAVTISTSSGNITIDNGSSDDDIIFKGTDGGSDITALTLDMSDAGRATFNGSIDIGGGLITRTGDLTLDVSGDIILDADGENIKFLDGGTERGQIDMGSANFTLRASTSDKDMIFRVNDGGSEIVAMTIDASEAANIKVESGNVLMETAGKYVQVAGSSSTYWAIGSTGGSNPPGTASTSLAFHHWDGSAWNNEVEFDSSGNITLDGSIVFSNNSKLRQDSAGLIMETLDSDEDLLFIGNDGGNVIIAARMDMSDGGHLICNNNVTAFGSTSDIKLKENIEVIPDALDKVKQLKGITFNYKKDGKRSTGLIAQDLEKVLPEVVYETSDINDEDKHLAVRYGNTVGLLVEAIKELSEKIQKLENK